MPERLRRYLPPEHELSERFVTAKGPGGQHVNRVATAVQLRFDVRSGFGMNDAVKSRLLRLAGSRASADGVITIEARSHRSQYRNRQLARRRLAELIARAHQQRPGRIATAPSRAARRRRLEAKRQRARIKKLRMPPD